jgi:hypothetical protein
VSYYEISGRSRDNRESKNGEGSSKAGKRKVEQRGENERGTFIDGSMKKKRGHQESNLTLQSNDCCVCNTPTALKARIYKLTYVLT